MLGSVFGKELGRVDWAQSPRHTTRNDPRRNKDVNRMKGYLNTRERKTFFLAPQPGLFSARIA
jgi:hypothetical protein